MTTGQFATILTGLATVIVGFFTFWNTRQANQIKRLSDEAEARKVQRLAEREADRLDKEGKQKEFEFWRDAHRDLSKQYTDEHASYVALATKHDEFRRDFDSTKLQLMDLKTFSENQSGELIHLKTKQDESQALIASMHDARLAADRNYEDTISRMNDDSTRKQDTLQTQIDRLTIDLRDARSEIADLHRQVLDFNSVNMQLERKIREANDYIDLLLSEKAILQGQLAALKVSAPAQPEPPEPTPDPGARQPIPVDFEPAALLPKTGTDA